MSILIACKCGVRLAVAAEHAGKRTKCPKCGMFSEVPMAASVFVPRGMPVEPEAKPPGPRRPFYRDPIVIVGVSIPTLILGIFFGYLWREQSNAKYRANVDQGARDAQKLTQSGHVLPAYEAYEKLLVYAEAKNPGSPADQRSLSRMREAMDRISGQALREREARRTLQAERAAAAKALSEHRDEMRRLAMVRSEIRGKAWVDYKGRGHEAARGMRVYLVPAELPKAKVLKTLALLNKLSERMASVMSEREHSMKLVTILRRVSEYAEENLADTSDKPIESVKLHAGIRLLGGETRAGVNEDPIWPAALAEMNATFAETSIDGVFEFQNVAGGYYYLFAIYQNEKSLAEWMTSLKVDKPTTTCDLFNAKAERILND